MSRTLGAALVLAAFVSGPTQAQSTKEAFVACNVLKPGSFDGHNGAIFFSDIGKVTIVYGKALDGPPKAFLAKVRSTYNLVGGHAGCWTGDTESDVRRQMDEMASAPSYRAHKKVQTGIAP